jgi:hypothetical protein
MPRIRRGELRRRRARRKKLAALRSRYEHAEDKAEKAVVLKKLLNVAPWLALEFRDKADRAALRAEEIGRREKKVKRARRATEDAGPHAAEEGSKEDSM